MTFKLQKNHQIIHSKLKGDKKDMEMAKEQELILVLDFGSLTQFMKKIHSQLTQKFITWEYLF